MSSLRERLQRQLKSRAAESAPAEAKAPEAEGEERSGGKAIAGEGGYSPGAEGMAGCMPTVEEGCGSGSSRAAEGTDGGKATAGGDGHSAEAEGTAGGRPITEEAGRSGTAEPQAESGEWTPLGAALHTAGEGAFILRRRAYEPEHRHGRYRLGDLSGRMLTPLLSKGTSASTRRGAGPSAARDENAGPGEERGAAPSLEMSGLVDERGAAWDRLLFLDTETTGLGLGTGNVPFMVGLGFWEEGRFIVEQLLIRHPGEEEAMLKHVAARLAERPYLVSYNGKSFDWPILKSRYVMNRIAQPAEPLGHIDFLYPSRSLWKHSLPSCRLGQVEEDRLGVVRTDDVPGSLAPTLYFQYLAERDPRILLGVFEHNELDVLSLAVLAIHFSRIAEGEAEWSELRLFGADEIVRHGLWLEKTGLHRQADGLLERLAEDLTAEGAEAAVGASAALLPLAAFFKQRRRSDIACRLWRLYISEWEERFVPSIEPFVELSMHYEHKEKRYDVALQFAEEALDAHLRRERFQAGGAGRRQREAGRADAAGKERSELAKRIERLRRKLERERQSQAQRAGGGESQGAGRLSAASAGKGRSSRKARAAEAPQQQELFLEGF